MISDPIFKFIQSVATKTGSQTSAYLTIPDSSVSGSFLKNVSTQFFKKSESNLIERRRQQTIQKLHEDNEKRLEASINSNETVINLKNEIEIEKSNLVFLDNQLRSNGTGENGPEPNAAQKQIDLQTKKTALLNKIKVDTDKLENEKSKIRQLFKEQNITQLVSRLENPGTSGKFFIIF
jgi:hypothetical protein